MALSASDLQAIYGLLTNSMSGDDRVRKPAEIALSQSESRPGFCSCLMEVITSKDLVAQVDVRLMASVYFKNSINRYWRNRRDSVGISRDEKVHLRQKLLSHLREDNDQIALMLAVLISKIARFDYPKEWPELFSALAEQLRVADTLSSHRIFLILFRTLKELSTKRLTSDQRTYAEISSHLFDFSWHLWQTDVQTILRGFSSLPPTSDPNSQQQNVEQAELYLICERWLLCLKIIRQLVISGYPSDSKVVQDIRPVKEVCPVLLTAIQSVLPYYSSLQNRYPKFWDFIKRTCTKIMKVLVSIQGRHPYSFGDSSVLKHVMEFCLNSICNSDPATFEPFLIQCMIMVKSVVDCKEYKPSLTGRVMDESGASVEQMKKNMSNAIGHLLSSLMPNDRIVLLCDILIRRYFVLTASDLEEWYQHPESFHHEQDMVQWTEKLRPCAEALYIVLFENHSQLLGPYVVSILQEAMTSCPTSVTEITPGLLLKDAAYGATAYVYYELSNYLSFKDWFNAALSLELSNDHPNMRIIHRKVAVILGHWVSEGSAHLREMLKALNERADQIKDETKRPVYCALIKLLQGTDLAVRLAACRSLCSHIEDANFLKREFVDLLPICYDLCFKLVEDVQEFDSKVQVLNLITVLIGHENEVIPFANKLLEFFQKIWEESSGESLLQMQLLIALRSFVIALGDQSPLCYNVLLPILQKGIDIYDPDELNLLEDSMLLWEVTISHAPSMVPQLLSYFTCLMEIIDRSFDHLQVAVNIIEGYIILGGSEFLSMHASNIAKLLDLVVGNVNDRGLLSTLPVIDILIQCFPVEVPPLINSSLQKLIAICLSGDDRDPSKAAVKASSATILARILVMNTNYLGQLTSDPSLPGILQNAGVHIEENILLCLVDVWLDKVDHASTSQRKTLALALSIILTLRMPQVLDKLDQILSVCTGVLMGGINDQNEEESSSDSSDSRSNCDIIPSKELRRRQIKYSDPINQLSLEQSMRDNLQMCASIHGESFNSVIGRMHPSTFAQLKQVLKMP